MRALGLGLAVIAVLGCTSGGEDADAIAGTGATVTVASGGGGASGRVAAARHEGDGGEQPAGPCPNDMVHAGQGCIDRFSAPNVAGAEPLAMQTAPEGGELVRSAWQAAVHRRRVDSRVRGSRGDALSLWGALRGASLQRRQDVAHRRLGGARHVARRGGDV